MVCTVFLCIYFLRILPREVLPQRMSGQRSTESALAGGQSSVQFFQSVGEQRGCTSRSVLVVLSCLFRQHQAV